MKTITVYSHACNSEYDMDSYLPEDKHSWSSTGVYLHGELESLVGYDIVYVPNDAIPSDLSEANGDDYWKQRYAKVIEAMGGEGIHNFVVKADGKEYNAIGYVYPNKNRLSAMRGLIVLESDTQSVEYAKKCYEEKQCFL